MWKCLKWPSLQQWVLHSIFHATDPLNPFWLTQWNQNQNQHNSNESHTHTKVMEIVKFNLEIDFRFHRPDWVSAGLPQHFYSSENVVKIQTVEQHLFIDSTSTEGLKNWDVLCFLCQWVYVWVALGRGWTETEHVIYSFGGNQIFKWQYWKCVCKQLQNQTILT